MTPRQPSVVFVPPPTSARRRLVSLAVPSLVTALAALILAWVQ